MYVRGSNSFIFFLSDPRPGLSLKVVLCLQVLQLYQITQLHHGLMMVGPSGSGKSSAWKVLLKALERIEGVEGVSHIIDPKVSSMHGHTVSCMCLGKHKSIVV